MNANLALLVKGTLVEYLEKYNYLDQFTTNIEHFTSSVLENINKFKPTLYCPIYLNLTQLSEFSGNLAFLVITMPNVMQQICTNIILNVAEEILQNKTQIYLEQIVSPIVIVQQSVILGDGISNNLCSIKGILAELTYPQIFIRTSNWKCKSLCCARNAPIIVQNFPKSLPYCPSCGAEMTEIPNTRSLGTFTEGQLIPSQLLKTSVPSLLIKWMNFRIEDDRICNSTMNLGTEYICTGIRIDDHLDVWGCQMLNLVPSPLWSISKLEQVRSKFQNDAWTFGEILSYSIGAKKYPFGAFKHLRTGLLLSLASMGSKPPLPIMAVCEEYNIGVHLMSEALELAERYTKFSYPFKQTGVTLNQITQTLTGGALTLAQGGVCYITDLLPYVGKKGDSIRHAVEFGEIPVDGAVEESVPLKCAVWTLVEKAMNQKDLEHIQLLSKIFSFAWRVESCQEVDEVDCNLDNKNLNHYLIPQDELKQYLASINTIKVTLTDEASIFLQNYIVCALKARGDSLPATAIKSLQTLSEAHARLNNLHFALLEDVLVAIQLCEIAMGPLSACSLPPNNLKVFGNWLTENMLF